MPATATTLFAAPQTIAIPTSQLKPNHFSLSIYGDPAAEIDDLILSISNHGILVALVVAPASGPDTWEVLSGSPPPCLCSGLEPRRSSLPGTFAAGWIFPPTGDLGI